MEIILDRKKINVTNTISRNELLELAGVTKEMIEKALTSFKSAGTGWEVYRMIPNVQDDEKLNPDEIINLKDNKYNDLSNRRFFTACTNTWGG